MTDSILNKGTDSAMCSCYYHLENDPRKRFSVLILADEMISPNYGLAWHFREL